LNTGVAYSLGFKARPSASHSDENDFLFHANKTHFYKKGFAISLVLKERGFET